MTIRTKYIFLGIAVFGLLFLAGCGGADYTKPIEGFGFEDIFVYPMAGLLWVVAKTVGFGHYGLSIIITTLIVRTLAWPIYAKTNDMSLKMQLVSPEAEKIKQKYAGKEDEQSKQRMNMETMQLYKKYGIGLGGCLMPILQMPIFIGFFRMIGRMPATLLETDGSGELIYGNLIDGGHWLRVFNTTEMFGIDLLQGQTDVLWQKWGVIILAALVGITQIFSLILTQKRQKKMKQEQQANTPKYRLQQQQQGMQGQTEKTMKVMMYVMTGMMVFFVLANPAGLGLYWFVGNLYSTLQSYIGHLNSKKRLETLRQKY